MINQEDDVPPLEDMSEMLQKITVKQQKPHDADGNNKNLIIDNVGEEKSHKAFKPEKKTFGGLKKGFLFSKSSTSENSISSSKAEKLRKAPTLHQNDTSKFMKEKETDIPLLKSKSSKTEELSLPEVQSAMKATEGFLQNKDWVTEDLLSKVMKHDKLAKKLENPQFMKAITEFQVNPAAAMQKYQKNSEIQMFLKEFCRILGEHFETLADMNEPLNKDSNSTNTSDIIKENEFIVESETFHTTKGSSKTTAEDEKLMSSILSDPEIKDILLDSRIQNLIETLRTNPDAAQRTVHLANKDLQKKIKKLVECGLLQFQR